LIVKLKRSGFNLKFDKNLKEYLSFQIIEDKELNQVVILEPNLINNLRDMFGNEVLEERSYRIPQLPRFRIIRLDQDSELIDPEFQIRYWSRV
jgi:hypothetical protein